MAARCLTGKDQLSLLHRDSLAASRFALLRLAGLTMMLVSGGSVYLFGKVCQSVNGA